MPVALTNRTDIIANSVSVIDANYIQSIMGLIGSIHRIISGDSRHAASVA